MLSKQIGKKLVYGRSCFVCCKRHNHSSDQSGNSKGSKGTHKNLKLNYEWQELANLSKEKLIYRLIRTQRKLDQFKGMCDPSRIDGRDKIRIPYPGLDDSKDETKGFRRVAFKILYLGWHFQSYYWSKGNYLGDTTYGTNIVERIVLEALFRQQLQVKNVPFALDRSGRTDRDVSAFSQTISVNIASKLHQEYGVSEFGSKRDKNDRNNGHSISDTSLDSGEYPYVRLLNEALPLEIRVLAWSPVVQNFSPRATCKSRTYRFMFIRGALDIELMRTSAQCLVGCHDFRNLCSKSDENAFKDFRRKLISVEIVPDFRSTVRPEIDQYALVIRGEGFLNKQVRHIMTVLCTIGLGKAPPDILKQMLDVENFPKKPSLALSVGLNLVKEDAEFDDDVVHWRWDQDALTRTALMLADKYSESSAKSGVIKTLLEKVVEKMTTHHEAVGERLAQGCLADGFDGFIVEDPNAKNIEQYRQDVLRLQIRRNLRRGNMHNAVKLQEKLISAPDQPDSVEANEADNNDARDATNV